MVGVIGGSIIALAEFAGANVSRSVAVIRLDPNTANG